MNISEIVDEINNDPKSLGYSGKTAEEIWEIMKNGANTALKPINSRELLSWSAGNGRLIKLVTAKDDPAGNPAIRAIAQAAFMLISRADTELNLNDPSIVGMVDVLVQSGVFEEADKDILVLMATVSISRTEELWGGEIHISQIKRALEVINN